MTHQSLTLVELKRRARSGRAPDVDYMMAHLDVDMSFSTSRLIDFALGLVASDEGCERLRHFLFAGNQVQRNYAALYFKRRGATDLLDEAIRRGCIDSVQAYAS